MKIINKSIFHDNEIKKMVEFAMPEFLKQVFSERKNKLKLVIEARTGNGHTSELLTDYKTIYKVCLQVPWSYSKYPFREQDLKTMLQKNKISQNVFFGGGKSTYDYVPSLFLDRAEVVVHCAAHEFRHILQIITGSYMQSDLDADMYAIHKQRQWRHLNNKGIL
jgi:hypothetical protein